MLDVSAANLPVKHFPVESIPPGWIAAVAFSPNGKGVAAACGDDSVKLWDAASGKMIWSTPRTKSAPSAIAIAPNGTRIISGHWDGTWSVWDAQNGILLRSGKGHRENVTGVAICRDGKQFATSSGDDTFRVWDFCSGELRLTVAQGDEYDVTCAAVSPDGRRIVSGSKGELKIWELT